jgi:cyclopropane-fatty-acyl-phospholipid synthase
MSAAGTTESTTRAYSGASTDAIQHHYDVGNQFYELWLDETLTYSSALWDGVDDLHAAQLAKLDHHVASSRAAGAANVLDIGCGWGSTLHRLVTTHGVKHGVGLSLSAQQLAHIETRRIPNVEVRLESWSDHVPKAPYDAIISIGAFEHFARPDVPDKEKVEGYRDFFKKCHEWLRPGACLSLQTISYENSARSDFSPFFAEHIFPESDLPRLSEIAIASDRLFEVVSLRNDRMHYARTMNEWRKRLRARREEAVAMVGEPVVERYDRYLQLCAIGFHVGTMGLLRIAFRSLKQD